jgi:O-antigen biosynthesis protein WbqP
LSTKVSNFSKRTLDILGAITCTIIFLVPSIFIIVAIKINSNGPAIYWSKRVGQYGNLFPMPKFRSMYEKTPEVATDRLKDPQIHITKVGRFLRKSSLDELPQIWSILIGDMSFVGPRPALYNQLELIRTRKEKNIDTLIPGLTGWAQINGRDNLTDFEKVKLEEVYLKNKNVLFDIKIIYLTVIKALKTENVSF